MKSNDRRQELLPPFSAEEHDSYLGKIQERLAGIKEQMQVVIEDNLTLFMETLDQTTQLSQQVDRVSKELKSIHSRVSDPTNSLFAVVINTTKRRRALADSERHTGIMIKVLEALVHIKKELEMLNSLIQQRKLIFALKQHFLIQNLILQLPGGYTPGNEPIIYNAVKQRFEKLHQDLVDILLNAFIAAFRFDPKAGTFSVTTPSNDSTSNSYEDEIAYSIPLATCLAMMHSLELARPSIDRFASSLFTFIDNFLLEPTPSTSLPTLTISTKGSEPSITIGPSKSQNSNLGDIASSISMTVTFFQFLTDFVIVPLKSEFIRIQAIVNKDIPLSDLDSSISGLCLHTGSLILPFIVDRLVSRCFEPSIPEVRSALKAYQRDVENQVDSFVPKLTEFSWLPGKGSPQQTDMGLPVLPLSPTSSEIWNSKLIDFLKNAPLHFATKKRKMVLARVRSLLLSQLYTSQIVGELEFGALDSTDTASDAPLASSLFKFPECRVREVVIELVQIAENLVAEAFENDEESNSSNRPTYDELRLQSILLDTSKDIFDMYRAIIPSYEQSKIAHIPQLSMLFHNDCQYMAHRLVMLNSRYHLQFMHSRIESAPPSPSPSLTSANAAPSAVSPLLSARSTSGAHNLRKSTATAIPVSNNSGHNFTLIDLVTAFREMGERFYNDILTAFREQLLVLLENMDQLSNTHHEERKKKALIVMRHIVNELENKDRTWSDTLPRELHKVTMGQLVNEVAEWMIKSALLVQDFTADETESLHIIFSQLFPVAKIFVDVSDTVPNGNSSADGNPSSAEHTDSVTKSSCARYVKSWLRLEELADAFKMPMVEIVDRFNAGVLHFSRSEIESLIKALFAETPKRADRIASLRRGLDLVE